MSGAPRFDVLRGPAAEAAAGETAGGCFQQPRWVRAVAAARGRAHTIVVVRARWADGREALLPGATGRRFGLPVFESMPMGGYGGWIAPSALAVDEECALNRAWLACASWPLVVLTSAPGRGVTLPAPPAPWRWMPQRLRAALAPRRFATHVLDLQGDDTALLQRARKHMRSYLRKSDQLGFEFDLAHDTAALDRLHRWYSAGSGAWQQAATTLLPRAFFAALEGQGADVWTIRHGGREVGAALFLAGANEVNYQASGTVRVAGPLGAMDAAIWAAARHYRDRGHRALNLGASEGLESVARFKEKFGALAVPYLRVAYLLPRLFRPHVTPVQANGGSEEPSA